jgi:3-methyladenine DNA glycosylase AlkD
MTNPWDRGFSDFGEGPNDFGLPGNNEAMRAITVLTSRLAHAQDASYSEELKSGFNSQPAHGVRLPKVKGIVKEWLKDRRDWPEDFLFSVCDGLWSTGWREERLAAIAIVVNTDLIYGMDWADLDRWSKELDNAEMVDNLAGIPGRMLQMNPRLHTNVRNLANSNNRWQRRLALSTMIVAAHDAAWQPGLTAMIERLQADDEPVVQDALAKARARVQRFAAKRG